MFKGVTSWSGKTETQPRAHYLHVIKLICAFWSIAQKQLRLCRPDVGGPHIELALVETVKSI